MASIVRRWLQSSAVVEKWSQQKLRLKLVNKHKPAWRPEQTQPMHYEDRAAALPLNNRYLHNLSLLWRQRDAITRDANFRKDDALVKAPASSHLPPLEPANLRLGFEEMAETKGASSDVLAMLSVKYGNRSARRALWREKLVRSVRADALDAESIPAQMAELTYAIRYASHLLAELAEYSPRNPKRVRYQLEKDISHRRRLGRILRERDAETAARVEKTLGLDLSQIEAPLDDEKPKENYPWHSLNVERFEWVRAQVEKRVEAEKAKRLEEYRIQMEKERLAFQEMKAKRTAEIQEQMEELRAKLSAASEEEGADGGGSPAQAYHPSTIDTSLLKDRIHRQFYDIDGKRI